ncbi:MAG: F0F1 ATP synthase subunit B [Spirochaetales bacterium]|nr:F0F1 ATP synthase subunit B [Spirochaetales bacterium]
MDLFKIDPGLAIWTWITFGILFFLLSKFAFPTLLKNLKDREEMIAESVDNASKIETKLAAVEKEQAEIIRRSQEEAKEILRKTREDAQQMRKNLLEEAEKEAREIVEQARLTINEERADAIKSLRAQIAAFTCDTAEQLIGRSFVSADDRKWAEELAKAL